MTARWLRSAALVAAVLALTACAAGANDLIGTAAVGREAPVGFWFGLWHGFICPFTFLVSLFSDSVGIYEVHNNGGWYNFGFVLGASAIFGGGAGSGRSARSRRA